MELLGKYRLRRLLLEDRHPPRLDGLEAFGKSHDRAAASQFKLIGPCKGTHSAARINRIVYEAECDALTTFAARRSFTMEWQATLEQRRYDLQEPPVRYLRRGKSLTPGLTVRRARALLWALTGRGLFQHLVLERGWTGKDYERWLGELLVMSLLRPCMRALRIFGEAMEPHLEHVQCNPAVSNQFR